MPWNQTAAGTALRQVRQARARMTEVREAIAQAATPEEIDRCAPMIEDAIACLQSAPSWHREPGLVREFEALRFELGVAGKLIAGGLEFYGGWARILTPSAVSYTSSGVAPQSALPGSVSVIG